MDADCGLVLAGQGPLAPAALPMCPPAPLGPPKPITFSRDLLRH